MNEVVTDGTLVTSSRLSMHLANGAPRIATVWWLDAHHGGDEYQSYQGALDSHRPMLRGETGWVVIDTDAGVTLALSWLPKDAGDNYCPRSSGQSDFIDISFIPRFMIESVDYWT